MRSDAQWDPAIAERLGINNEMPGACTLVIPWPPTLNHAYANVVDGGRVKTANTKRWQKLAAQALQPQRWHPMKTSDRVKVTINLHPPNSRPFDIDNRCKALLDALQRARVVDNDNQVDVLVVNRLGVKPGGMAVVMVEAIE